MNSVASKLVFVVTILLFRMLLDLSYVIFVSPLYSYAGFDLGIDVFDYAMSWVLFVMSCFLTSHRLNKVSDYFFIIAVLGVVSPISSLYGLSSRGVYPVIISILSIGLVYLVAKSRLFKAPKIPVFNGGPKLAVTLSSFMVLLLIMWYFASGAVGYFNLNLSHVYEFRELSAEKANIGVLAYLNNWVYQVFSIFLFAYALLKRRFDLAIMVFSIQVFFFGVSAHKSVLFYPLMVLGIWFYFRKTSSLVLVPMMFFLIVLASLMSWHFFGDIITPSLFIRRVFFIPALLTYDYFSFFEGKEHVFWSNSILSSFIDYPYHTGLNALIGEYNGSDGGANNGYIASGYAHAGWFGVLIYSIVFGYIIRFVDVFSKNLPVWFALSIVIVPYRSALISSDLLTVLLTHGLFAALVVLVMVRENREVITIK
ncbi:MAG: hypothetical protein V7681_07205 [Halopseudomonas sabulinigri]